MKLIIEGKQKEIIALLVAVKRQLIGELIELTDKALAEKVVHQIENLKDQTEPSIWL